MDNKLYRYVRVVFGAVLVLSLGTLGIAAVVGGSGTVWVRDSIVIVISIVLFLLAGKAFRGSRKARLRMILMTVASPVAIAVIVALPNDGFPAWMKVEQVLVGVLLVTAAVPLCRSVLRGSGTGRMTG